MICIQQKLRGLCVLHCFKTAIITGIFTLSLSAHIQADALQSQAKAMFGVLPTTMPGSENDSAELIALGEKLYMDKRLSVNNSQSCNTCHNVTDGGPGVDNTVFSAGAIAGKFGGRNAPTVWNAGFQLAQFWDGRAQTLEEQASFPIFNPNEMAMTSEDEVIIRLKSIGYLSDFQHAFPMQASPINIDNISNALASFLNQRFNSPVVHFNRDSDGDLPFGHFQVPTGAFGKVQLIGSPVKIMLNRFISVHMNTFCRNN